MLQMLWRLPSATITNHPHRWQLMEKKGRGGRILLQKIQAELNNVRCQMADVRFDISDVRCQMADIF